MSEKTKEVKKFQDKCILKVCITILYSDRLCRQVGAPLGAPLWFSQTLPLKACKDVKSVFTLKKKILKDDR